MKNKNKYEIKCWGVAKDPDSIFFETETFSEKVEAKASAKRLFEVGETEIVMVRDFQGNRVYEISIDHTQGGEPCPACDELETSHKCTNPLCIEGMAKKDVKDLTQEEANGLESFKKKAVEEIVSQVNKVMENDALKADNDSKPVLPTLTADDIFMDLFIVDYDNQEVNLEIKYGRTGDRSKYNTTSFKIPRKTL